MSLLCSQWKASFHCVGILYLRKMRSTVMFMLTCLHFKVKHLICLYFPPFPWFSCTVWVLTSFSIPSFGETVSELRINICIMKHKCSRIVYNILATAYLVLPLSQIFGLASSLFLLPQKFNLMDAGNAIRKVKGCFFFFFPLVSEYNRQLLCPIIEENNFQILLNFF